MAEALSIDAGNRGSSGRSGKAEVLLDGDTRLKREKWPGIAGTELGPDFCRTSESPLPGVADGTEQHTMTENKPGSHHSSWSIHVSADRVCESDRKGS
jgi:hypothetical protein